MYIHFLHLIGLSATNYVWTEFVQRIFASFSLQSLDTSEKLLLRIMGTWNGVGFSMGELNSNELRSKGKNQWKADQKLLLVSITRTE